MHLEHGIKVDRGREQRALGDGPGAQPMDLVDPTATMESALQALQYCIKMGYTDVVRKLLTVHFSKTKLSDFSASCHEILVGLVKSGSRDMLLSTFPFVDESFLKTKGLAGGKDYLTKLLCLAVENGQKDIVEVLCQNGADLDVFVHGRPLLHFAIAEGHSEVTQILIEFGANVFACDKRGENVLIPVMVSNIDEKNKILNLLMSKGLNPNQCGGGGKMPIHVAAAHSANGVKCLVAAGCDVNSHDLIHLDTPLHVACSRCCLETVEVLIKSGAKFNILNNAGETALDKLLRYATDFHSFHSKTRMKLARALIDIGFRINTECKNRNPRKQRRGSARCKGTDVYHSLISNFRPKVPSLQHMCRLVVRDSIQHVDVNSALNDLCIPVDVISYVAFKNFKLVV